MIIHQCDWCKVQAPAREIPNSPSNRMGPPSDWGSPWLPIDAELCGVCLKRIHEEVTLTIEHVKHERAQAVSPAQGEEKP